MKALVIYDSFFGNTEKIARSIAAALEERAEVSVLRVSEVKPEQLAGVDLAVVGSPTRAFQPSEATKNFFKTLPNDAFKGIHTAAFDTRIPVEETNSGILRFLVKLFGYAAEPVQKQLAKKGGQTAGAAKGFYVKDTEGPLKEGELERAAEWARSLAG